VPIILKRRGGDSALSCSKVVTRVEISGAKPVTLLFCPGCEDEYIVRYTDGGKETEWSFRDGREALNKYIERIERALWPRLDRYEKGRPAVTGRPGDVAEATSDTTDIISLPPKNVNGGTK
jgi:hypothetical protein